MSKRDDWLIEYNVRNAFYKIDKNEYPEQIGSQNIFDPNKDDIYVYGTDKKGRWVPKKKHMEWPREGMEDSRGEG